MVCLSLSQQSFSKQIPFRESMKRPCSSSSSFGSRVFVVSDLHTDYSENMRWVKCLSTTTHNRDVLLVAGDVAETYNNFVSTMSLLKERFQHDIFVPGNHDLWCRWETDYSVRNRTLTGLIVIVEIIYICFQLMRGLWKVFLFVYFSVLFLVYHLKRKRILQAG